MNGKVSNQNNIEEVVSYHHSQKSISHTYNTSRCVHSQTVAVCSCSYLAQSRNKLYYLYVKQTTTLALIAKKKLESLLIFPV